MRWCGHPWGSARRGYAAPRARKGNVRTDPAQGGRDQAEEAAASEADARRGGGGPPAGPPALGRGRLTAPRTAVAYRTHVRYGRETHGVRGAALPHQLLLPRRR